MDHRIANATTPSFNPSSKTYKGSLFRTLVESTEESWKNNYERWVIFSSTILMETTSILSSGKKGSQRGRKLN